MMKKENPPVSSGSIGSAPKAAPKKMPFYPQPKMSNKTIIKAVARRPQGR